MQFFVDHIYFVFYLQYLLNWLKPIQIILQSPQPESSLLDAFFTFLVKHTVDTAASIVSNILLFFDYSSYSKKQSFGLQYVESTMMCYLSRLQPMQPMQPMQLIWILRIQIGCISWSFKNLYHAT